MKTSIPLKVKCLFCERTFTSVAGRLEHEKAKHVPAAEPEAPDAGRLRYFGFMG